MVCGSFYHCDCPMSSVYLSVDGKFAYKISFSVRVSYITILYDSLHKETNEIDASIRYSKIFDKKYTSIDI